MPSLAEEYPKEQARVRELLQEYRAIGPSGAFGAAIIEAKLREAEAAAISGDMIRIIQAFKDLKDCE